MSVLADGRLVGRSDWNWNGLYIHELDGTITEINLTEPAYDFTTNQNDIYFTNQPISFRLDGDMGYGKGFDADVNFNNFEIIEMSGTRTIDN